MTTKKEEEYNKWAWNHRNFLKAQIEKKKEELYEIEQQLADHEIEMEEEGILNPKR